MDMDIPMRKSGELSNAPQHSDDEHNNSDNSEKKRKNSENESKSSDSDSDDSKDKGKKTENKSKDSDSDSDDSKDKEKKTENKSKDSDSDSDDSKDKEKKTDNKGKDSDSDSDDSKDKEKKTENKGKDSDSDSDESKDKEKKTENKRKGSENDNDESKDKKKEILNESKEILNESKEIINESKEVLNESKEIINENTQDSDFKVLGLSNNELDEIRQTFNLFDSNTVGKLETKEITKMLNSLGFDTKNPSISEILNQFNSEDSSKKIDFETFIKTFDRVFLEIEDDTSYKRIFNLFVDGPAADTISLKSLRTIINELGDNMTSRELKQMVEEGSSDGACLTFKDFCKILRPNLENS